MKIATVTLNPAIDKHVYLNTQLQTGTINRVSKTVVNVGGKGINQAVMFSNLGVSVDCFYFSGAKGGFVKDYLISKKINPVAISTQAEIRENIKIIDSNGTDTEINEAGGPYSGQELNNIITTLCEGNYDIVTLSGSIPQGVEKFVYNSIIKELKKSGTKVFLDCDGDALRLGYAATPYLIKPNKREICELLGLFEGRTTKEELFDACKSIIEKNKKPTTTDVVDTCTNIICTFGPEGSMYVGNDGACMIGTVNTKLKGFAGAGDSYLAGFIFSRFCEGKELKDALRFAAATSVAKIQKEGTEMPSRDEISELIDRIEIYT